MVLCEVCHKKAVDIHHIDARGIGGDPQGKKDRIENLQAVCRECHTDLGDKKQYKHFLMTKHQKRMELNKVEFDEDYVKEQLSRYENFK